MDISVINIDAIALLFSISPLRWAEVMTAVGSGVVVGVERQMLGKPAGIRTCALICLSTYLFIAIGRTLPGDQLRVLGQVVTGVGFLGGGVILSKEGIIQGMTSASVIWALSAIGVVIGLGYPLTGFKMSLLVVLILVGLDIIERNFINLRKGVHKEKRRKPGLFPEE